MDTNIRHSIFFWLTTILREHEKISFSEIKRLLQEEYPNATEDEIFEQLQEEITTYGRVIRSDYWEKETEYTLLDQRIQESSYARNYYSFEVDNTKTKKFLLISDTHVGDMDMEDFKLLDNVYDHGIKRGAPICFHLGDVFAGRYKKNTELTEEEKIRQLTEFINYYPNPTPEEMRTYAIRGNRDKHVANIINNIPYGRYIDLRELTRYKKSFYMFPRDQWQTNFSDKSFKFSHKLYISSMIRDLKINSMSDIKDQEKWLDFHHDVQISGHLHKGMIYTTKIPDYPEVEKIFLNTPSTSQINIGKPVAFLVTLNYENDKVDNMEVTLLKSDQNKKIIEAETIPWSFKEKNKTYQKILQQY